MRLHRRVNEYRIVVPGRAISFRSPQARDYKSLVRHEAHKVFKAPLYDEPIEVRLDYFHIRRRRVDMDNIAKCILDALNGVAYADDRQVKLQSATAYSLQEPVFIYGGPVDLVKPLADYDEYLFIRIRGLSKREKPKDPT